MQTHVGLGLGYWTFFEHDYETGFLEISSSNG
jgi:hypothetical protein